MTTAAVVLAAGVGSRFDGPVSKLRAPFRGRPLATWALDAAATAGADAVLVVTGADDLGDLLPDGAETIANPRWAEGQATSLQAALTAARAAGHDAIVVGLADQPLIPASAWATVLAAGSDAPGIVVATYYGQRRNPVLLDRSVWDLLPTEGDVGARDLLRLRPDLVREVACDGEPVDIDTVEDLQRWS